MLTLTVTVTVTLILFFPVAALLEGFDIRECISFIEEHIIRQVRLIISVQNPKY